MMFLQGVERVLKNGILGAGMQGIEQLAKIGGLLPPYSEKRLGRVEVKRLRRFS
jgi:hypothetical protein